MALFTVSEVRARARKYVSMENFSARPGMTVDSSTVLRESVMTFSETKTYDVFLSHSIRDSEIILGVKGLLEDLKYRVYVDWIEDPQLDRSKVSGKTADVLRKRMRTSRSLVYVTTQNSDSSRWMPWECGYFDGFRNKVAILPVDESSADSFSGREYLELYPYCVKANDTAGIPRLWVKADGAKLEWFDSWLGTGIRNP